MTPPLTPESVLPPDQEVVTYADLALALGGSEDSFTGHLLRLIAKADPGNRARLRCGFPYHVAAWEIWHVAAKPLTARELTVTAVWASTHHDSSGRSTT